MESLDKWIIIDEVLPLLQSIPSREPAVLMAILGIIKVAMTSAKAGGLPREVLATKVIPFLIPISIETSLNLNQVDIFIIEWIINVIILFFSSLMPTCLRSKICYKPLKLNNEKNSNNSHNKQQSKIINFIEYVNIIFYWISSAPIVPIGPSATDIHLDHNSSSMVNLVQFLFKEMFR